MNSKFRNLLKSYTEAIRPIILINGQDSSEIDEIISDIAEEDTKIIEYNVALGIIDFISKQPMQQYSLEEFLRSTIDLGYSKQTFIVLKDINEEIRDPRVIGLLKRIAENNYRVEEYSCTVYIVSSDMEIPQEIETFVTVLEYPLPNVEEIRSIISSFAKDYEFAILDEDLGELAISFLGLSAFQVNQILGLAYQQSGFISIKDKGLILQEKTQFIKKSGLLELVNFRESIDDIGGLEHLKTWLNKKATIVNNLDKATKFGVDIPKGVMIVGMPGCGKSLTAKATASLFNVPLVRLDISRLLGKYVGESEKNMRKALALSEAISPCVVWIDELEKAFSGVGNNSGNEVTIRLFGQFLTWMQEKQSSVFIVATANDISSIPPEFLRKGRFDEIFFVDLPNLAEREQILKIHLKKRNKLSDDINIRDLAKSMADYNGADIENVVKETIENAFIEGIQQLDTKNFESVIVHSKSIMDTMSAKIISIRETVTGMDIQNASSE